MSKERYTIDWDYEELDGFEEEEEELKDSEESSEEEQPFNAERIRVETKPISVHQMREMINEEQLNLFPDFQRRKVWKEPKRKSLLIESLMLRIPLPVFYVYEDENAAWHIIDGLQRMSTIYDFLNGEFVLTGLQYLIENNKKKFVELDQKYKNRIMQTTLTINVIDALTPPQVKYDIFRRINTGGVPLSAQEIRNSNASPKVRNFLNELVTSNEFKRVTNHASDLRMQAQELVLRFIAFYNVFDFNNDKIYYKKGMDNFLDATFEDLKKANSQQLSDYHCIFINAMKNAWLLFGRDAFRRPSDKHGKLNRINKSLFTCISVILAHYDYNSLCQRNWGGSLQKLSIAFQKNPEFDESFSKGTGDPRRIRVQFSMMKMLIEEMLDDAYETKD